MKKTIIFLALCLSLNSAQAQTASIEIKTTILPSVCKVISVPTLIIPDFYSDDLSQVGDKLTSNTGNLVLEDCPLGMIGITAQGGTASTDPLYWKNTVGTQKNIGFDLAVQGKSLSPSNREWEFSNPTPHPMLGFKASVVKIADGPITAGPAGTSVDIKIQYK
ncbi:fimbrial protein [Ignatzschineria rhizosphaerae]|uniref:Fimbrial protein n=1 Tax=Ignatzschineria rhizosphaerae TaxID=2923279 RepID=A0ABY3XAM1_9GAMM|nr:fimbrial protein [Ignatzschineria rhizosphaerae]UNM97008.1 fimbrial protein [Ignatzschineria rhizosphaerae]